MCYDCGVVRSKVGFCVPTQRVCVMPDMNTNTPRMYSQSHLQGYFAAEKVLLGSFLFSKLYLMRKGGYMSGNKQKNIAVPELDTIEAELQRIKYKDRYRSALKGTVYTLVVVAAVAILVATMWLPFLRIYGTSMSPTLQDGEIICCVKTSDFEVGDVVAFYYNNKLLVKRVIGLPGDKIDIDADGNVFVNGELLEEPYLTEKSLGDADIELPYQVPDGRVFVLGDHRSTSVDSRHSVVGCVSEEQVVGKILVRIWPLNRITSFGKEVIG